MWLRVAFLALRGPRTANNRKHVIPYSAYHTHYVGYLPPNQVEFIAGKCQFEARPLATLRDRPTPLQHAA